MTRIGVSEWNRTEPRWALAGMLARKPRVAGCPQAWAGGYGLVAIGVTPRSPEYGCRATHEEIAENDFNLNIPRYVDTFEAEKEVDLKVVEAEIARLETELAGVLKQMADYLGELGAS